MYSLFYVRQIAEFLSHLAALLFFLFLSTTYRHSVLLVLAFILLAFSFVFEIFSFSQQFHSRVLIV